MVGGGGGGGEGKDFPFPLPLGRPDTQAISVGASGLFFRPAPTRHFIRLSKHVDCRLLSSISKYFNLRYICQK